jgi:hypothetical protein
MEAPQLIEPLSVYSAASTNDKEAEAEEEEEEAIDRLRENMFISTQRKRTSEYVCDRIYGIRMCSYIRIWTRAYTLHVYVYTGISSKIRFLQETHVVNVRIHMCMVP